jgi:hypothetical protein
MFTIIQATEDLRKYFLTNQIYQEIMITCNISGGRVFGVNGRFASDCGLPRMLFLKSGLIFHI